MIKCFSQPWWSELILKLFSSKSGLVASNFLVPLTTKIKKIGKKLKKSNHQKKWSKIQSPHLDGLDLLIVNNLMFFKKGGSWWTSVILYMVAKIQS
jgi:hypothetical protein